ncbi:MAG TPA: hypothetical protein VIG80_12300 [Bacillaceae bacterium]
MRKLCLKWLLPAAILTYAFKKRYKLLNILLGNDQLRKWSIKAAMGIPGVRSQFISNAFRK